MLIRQLISCRRGAVSVLFATTIIPIIGLCGLAVDYGTWAEINAALYNAVNVAALNAVKTAAAGDLNNDQNYVSEAKTAAAEWFVATAFSVHPSVNGGTLTISITGTTSLTASVTYSGGFIYSTFGKLFGTSTYSFYETATATIDTAPYLEVVLMLDNSSSMDIGSSTADISNLVALSPCDSTDAYTGTTTDVTKWWNQTQIIYGAYACSYDSETYDLASPACAVPTPTGATATLAGYTLPFSKFTPQATTTGPGVTTASSNQTCTNLPKQSGNAMYPLAGPPCAFACHWTNSKNADGTTQDLYGLARRKGITLRLDEVKNAANYTLQQMSTDNVASFNNLSVGVYTFNSTVKQIYPTNCTAQTYGCEAGSDFTTAQSLVGSPPVLPSVADTGIVPELSQSTGTNDDTAFPEDMNKLASTYLTAAGDGLTATTPLKVLIIVTDGFQDDANLVGTASERKAFDPSYCQQFKSMGYQVYVVYTPYYPLMHTYYLQNMVPIVEGTGSNSLVTNLTACSSQAQNPSGTYYISAQNQSQLEAALSSFLKQALNSPARYTQ
jgi:Flp pilus assembly protein TadG